MIYIYIYKTQVAAGMGPMYSARVAAYLEDEAGGKSIVPVSRSVSVFISVSIYLYISISNSIINAMSP